ncbi:hypothetical protein L7F22_047471 [Adiantum nelumboides]|nr:hypothetical protein [Adiantum nelumboides]
MARWAGPCEQITGLAEPCTLLCQENLSHWKGREPWEPKCLRKGGVGPQNQQQNDISENEVEETPRQQSDKKDSSDANDLPEGETEPKGEVPPEKKESKKKTKEEKRGLEAWKPNKKAGSSTKGLGNQQSCWRPGGNGVVGLYGGGSGLCLPTPKLQQQQMAWNVSKA